MIKRCCQSILSSLKFVLVILGLTLPCSTNAGTDYLIIADHNLINASSLQNLVNYHTNNGLTVSVVDVSAIGATPDHIKAYINSVYTSTTPRDLDYVLIVGSTLSIPFRSNVYGDNPSEMWYSWLEGDDQVADIGLGRLPARTITELDQMINKTLNFHNNVNPGTWKNRVLLVASGQTSSYKECSEAVRTHVYQTPAPVFTTMYGDDPANYTNTDINNAINKGCLIVNYRGHGDINCWANWDRDSNSYCDYSAATLNNGTQTPIIFSITCNTLYMDNQISLGEAFVRQAQGAVAFIGSLRPSNSSGNSPLDTFLFCGAWDYGINSLSYLYTWAQDQTRPVFGTDNKNAVLYAVLGDPAIQLFDGNKFIVWESKADDDMVGSSSGNGDLIIDAGETIELTAYLLNTFNRQVSAIIGTLTTSDPYISINSVPVSFGNAGRAERLGNNTPFIISVSSDCPDGNRVSCTITVTGTPDGQGPGSWTMPLEFTVKRQPTATVTPANIVVTLSPGETKTVELTLKNTGSADLNYSIAELAGQNNPLSLCPARPYNVAIFRHTDRSVVSYFSPGAMYCFWEEYKRVLESDPQGRFTVSIIENLNSSTLAGFDRLVLPGNAVPDEYLDDVENWLTSDKRLIAVGDAIHYVMYSGLFWPDSRGTIGEGEPSRFNGVNPGLDGQRILTVEKPTEGYNLGDILTTRVVRHPNNYIFKDRAPTDIIALTEWNSPDTGKLFASERKIPGKGTIVTLGVFDTVFDDALSLVRNAIEGEGNLTWLSANPQTGTINHHSQSYISVTVGGAEVAPGDYQGYLRVYSNAKHPPLFVPVNITIPSAPPEVVTPAAASPNQVIGTTTALSVLGSDDGGESNLVYTWSAVGAPPAPVTFSPNGRNAAKNTTATFTTPGNYTLQAVIRDQNNQMIGSDVNVVVNTTLTSVTVTPASASVTAGATTQFIASANDQFGTVLPIQPAFAWTATGGGTISSSGLFTAGTTAGGPHTVTAKSGSVSGTADVTVTSAIAKVAILGSWIKGPTHAAEPGTNRALVVMLYGEGSKTISASSVRYGGQIMTKVVEKAYLSGAYSYTGAFILKEAGVAAATSGAISVTWASAPTTGSEAVSVFLKDVNQTTPIGDTDTGSIAGTTVKTAALETSAGDMVLAAGTAANNGTYTINNGFTRGIPETSASFGDITSAYKPATGVNETPSLTSSASQRQTIVGFVVKKAGAPANYTLTSSAVNGSIELNPAGGVYASGTVVTVTATPDENYFFTGWSGALSGSTNPTTVTMDANKSITANFVQGVLLSSYPGECSAGSIQRSPENTIGGDCDMHDLYAPGTVVTLTALPYSGYVFTGWSGDLSGSTNPTTITMDGNKSITANFVEGVVLSSYPEECHYGYIERSPENVIGGDCDIQDLYRPGIMVTVKAIAYSGYSFSHWSGDLSGSANPATITMSANKSVTAHYTVSTNPVTALTGWVSGTNNPKVAGSNRLMTVMVMGESKANFGATRVTYGGQTMTRQSERLYYVSGNRTYASIFTLNESGVSAATSGAIAVTWSTTPSVGHSIYSVLLSNVDQSTPVSDTAKKGLTGTTISTRALSAATGDMVIMCGATENNITQTFNNGFTKQFESNTGWGDGVGGNKMGTGVAETPKFTQSAGGRMVLCAMVVKKAP